MALDYPRRPARTSQAEPPRYQRIEFCRAPLRTSGLERVIAGHYRPGRIPGLTISVERDREVLVTHRVFPREVDVVARALKLARTGSKSGRRNAGSWVVGDVTTLVWAFGDVTEQPAIYFARLVTATGRHLGKPSRVAELDELSNALAWLTRTAELEEQRIPVTKGR